RWRSPSSWRTAETPRAPSAGAVSPDRSRRRSWRRCCADDGHPAAWCRAGALSPARHHIHAQFMSYWRSPVSVPLQILGGRYEVGELIGRGGMAEVHKGHDTRLGRPVAIKLLRSDLARDPTSLTRFKREAQSAAGLNHASIVAVYDSGDEIVT